MWLWSHPNFLVYTWSLQQWQGVHPTDHTIRITALPAHLWATGLCFFYFEMRFGVVFSDLENIYLLLLYEHILYVMQLCIYFHFAFICNVVLLLCQISLWVISWKINKLTKTELEIILWLLAFGRSFFFNSCYFICISEEGLCQFNDFINSCWTDTHFYTIMWSVS